MDAWMHGCMDEWMDGWMDCILNTPQQTLKKGNNTEPYKAQEGAARGCHDRAAAPIRALAAGAGLCCSRVWRLVVGQVFNKQTGF